MFMNKKALAVAISSALAVPMAAQAVSFNLSGQLNRAIMFADDGVASDIFFTDNSVSNSRFRLTGSEDMGNGMTAGFNLEWAASINSNDYVAIKQGGDKSLAGANKGGALSARKNEIWFSGNWGKLSVGQGQTATDGMGDADLSNTWLADFSTPVSWGGAMTFRTAGAAGAKSTIKMFNATTYFDGHSRRARIRYDTPAFGPLTISVDASQNDAWGVKGYVYTSLGGGDLSLALAYASGDNRFGRSDYGGSLSYLFSQGTNITLGWQDRDFAAAARNTATHWYAKLGHRWGNNAVSISYGETDDVLANGSEASSIGLGFVHSIPKPKVELYASYHNVSLDSAGAACAAAGAAGAPFVFSSTSATPIGTGATLARTCQFGAAGGGFEDIDVFAIGARIKFD
jgi:predicted porin